MKISNPTNDVQKEFNALFEAGGSKKHGIKKKDIYSLLKSAGEKLNALGQQEISRHLEDFPDRNPWHICFAMGLCWGHLARDESDYMDAATQALLSLNSTDLNTAKQFFYERGPDPVEKSLIGGYQMFQDVKLPDELPDSLEQFAKVQERWFGRVLKPGARPSYIGSWNATAMFLTAIFSKPNLWKDYRSAVVTLPPNGPVYHAMKTLSAVGLLSQQPEGSELDESFEPGAIYQNNALMAELITDQNDLNMVDLHSGLYMLGTKFKHSNQWS